MDSPARRRAALESAYGPWRPGTLHGLLDELVDRYADRPLIITDDLTLTYTDVAQSSRDLAAGLQARGVRPGDHVAMLLGNYPEFVTVKVALSRLGAVAVPLNYLYQGAELSYALRQSASSTLITMTAFAGLDQLAILDEIAPGWESGPTAGLPDLRQVILFSTDGRLRSGVPTLDDLAGTDAYEPVDVSPDDLADIVYTSGTTGSPKGVMLTHDASLRSAWAAALTRAFDDGWRVLFALPMYHLFGYVEGLLAALWAGGAIIPRLSFTAADHLQAAERHRADEVVAVPTMTIALLAEAERNPVRPSTLHSIMSAGAPTPAWAWEQCGARLGITGIVTGLGMTEAAAGMLLTRPEDPLEVQSTTVGIPKYAGDAGLLDDPASICRVRTVDPSTGEVLPDGAEGELCLASPCLLIGFWDKPEETAAVLQDGWLRTGDVGYVRPDGYTVLTGRTKELYKSGGELVMPKEIEELLSRQPGISQVFAIGLPDERWGEIGCAVVVRTADSSVTEDEIIGICKAQLARFKVPKRVVFLDEAQLPTTPTGKVQKFRLVQLVRDAAPI